MAILGPLEVDSGGAPVPVAGARLRTLLIRLALDAGRTVVVDDLARALWDGQPPAEQANAVQALVSRLRRALPDGSVLRSAAGGYRLEIPPDAVDSIRFTTLAEQGRRLLRDGQSEPAAARLRQALGLWRGPALADVAGALFAAAPAARLEELRVSTIEDRIDADLATGASPELVAELEELIAVHPLRERPPSLLMRALVAAGRQAEALAAFERFRTRVAEELGTDPSPQLRALHLDVLRGELPHPNGGASTNLRADLTSFVGRDAERQRVLAQLAAGRLVTLVGPGGAGKTRLATTVAADLVDQTPGGVWLAELAAVTDPDDVAQAVLAALARTGVVVTARAPDASVVEVAGRRDVPSRLVEALAGRPALLVLDNCEHVIEAVSRLVEELLGRAPGLRILVTSREPLGLIGEALCPVPPLPLPDPGADAGRAAHSPAVRLFVERAAAVRPGFALDEGTVADVVEICRRLDGLPLAIELAAARLRSASPAQVAARLGDRFRLLTGGSRTALPRQRTLRAVVDWSWDLLTVDERVLARRLAVFPAGLTPDAAEAVCADERLPAKAIADVLDALVDKSLLQVIDHDEPRFRMLDTIREYAWDRLAEAGESGGLLRAHASHYLALAEAAEPHLRRAEQLEWIGRLNAERDNLVAALHSACDRGDAATAVRLAAAMAMYWMMLGNHHDAAAWTGRALAVEGEAPQAPPLPRAVAMAVRVITSHMWDRRRSDHAAIVANVLATVAEFGARPPHPILAMVEPMVAMYADDTAGGLAAIERTLPNADAWTGATLRIMRSLILDNEGDPAGRRAELLVASATFRELGERWGLGLTLSELAEVQGQVGDVQGAVATLEESTRLMDELGARDDAANARVALAVMHARQGDVERARAELRAMAESDEVRAVPLIACRVLCTLAGLARESGDLAGAAGWYEAAAASASGAPQVPPQVWAHVAAGRCHLELDKGDPVAAQRHAAEALALGVQAKDMPVIATAAVAVAGVWLHRGEAGRAAEILGAAEALRGMPGGYDPDVGAVAAASRRLLRDAAYEAAYARGRSYDRARALDALEFPG